MKVILDTTIFRADPTFCKADMIILHRLGKEKKIELLIPEIVLREFITHEQEMAKTKGKLCLNEIRKYSSILYGTEENKLKDTIKKIEYTLLDASKKVRNRIENFIHETNATILKPNIDDYNETFDRYFNGEKPFKKIKERNDIPDCVIFVQTKKIKSDELVFISDDNNLREAVRSEGIKVFSNLIEFTKSKIIRDIIEINEKDDLLYYVLPQIISHDKLLANFYDNLENELYHKEVIDKKIPDDNNEGTISGIVGIDPIEFTKEEIIKHGAGLFTVPFYCEIDAYLEYYIFKSDYCILDEEKMSDITIEDWNDHYYQAEEEYPLICTGKLGLLFNTNITKNEIEDKNIDRLLNEVKISFTEIEITVKEY